MTENMAVIQLLQIKYITFDINIRWQGQLHEGWYLTVYRLFKVIRWFEITMNTVPAHTS